MVNHCDMFTKHFTDKMNRIHRDLDATVTVSNDIPLATACLELLVPFVELFSACTA